MPRFPYASIARGVAIFAIVAYPTLVSAAPCVAIPGIFFNFCAGRSFGGGGPLFGHGIPNRSIHSASSSPGRVSRVSGSKPQYNNHDVQRTPDLIGSDGSNITPQIGLAPERRERSKPIIVLRRDMKMTATSQIGPEPRPVLPAIAAIL